MAEAAAAETNFADTHRSEEVLTRLTALRSARVLRLLELVLVLVALSVGVAAVKIGQN